MSWLPSPEDALTILICHSLVHIAHNISETLFKEIEVISEQPQFSWEHFWRNAEDTGIVPYFSFILHWYGATTKKQIPDIPWNWYEYIALQIAKNGKYSNMPYILKRVLFELPFVKSPLSLVRSRIASSALKH